MASNDGRPEASSLLYSSGSWRPPGSSSPLPKPLGGGSTLGSSPNGGGRPWSGRSSTGSPGAAAGKPGAGTRPGSATGALGLRTLDEVRRGRDGACGAHAMHANGEMPCAYGPCGPHGYRHAPHPLYPPQASLFRANDVIANAYTNSHAVEERAVDKEVQKEKVLFSDQVSR